MKYEIYNCEIGETYSLTLQQVLNLINQDRGESWQPYDETDWREGLEEFCYPLMLIEKPGGQDAE
jgi:hypothetical protein